MKKTVAFAIVCFVSLYAEGSETRDYSNKENVLNLLFDTYSQYRLRNNNEISIFRFLFKTRYKHYYPDTVGYDGESTIESLGLEEVATLCACVEDNKAVLIFDNKAYYKGKCWGGLDWWTHDEGDLGIIMGVPDYFRHEELYKRLNGSIYVNRPVNFDDGYSHESRTQKLTWVSKLQSWLVGYDTIDSNDDCNYDEKTDG